MCLEISVLHQNCSKNIPLSNRTGNNTMPTRAGADPGFDQGGAPDRDQPKTAILGPQFCRNLVLGSHFWWSGGAWAPRAPPGSAPARELTQNST